MKIDSHHYRFIIEGLNFRVIDQNKNLIGFYTTLFIDASTYEEAKSMIPLLIMERLSKNKILKNNSLMFKPFLSISESYEVNGDANYNDGFTFFDMSFKDAIISTTKSIFSSFRLIDNSIKMDI